jgi:nuclear transport factor 2 (NTF2) superfamily protein
MTNESTPASVDADQARDLLAAAQRAWDESDLEALLGVLAPGIRIVFNFAPPVEGIDAARVWLSTRFQTQLGYRLTKRLRGCYGRTVVGQWTGTGHEADGRHYRAVGIELLTLDDADLITHWEATMCAEQVQP